MKSLRKVKIIKLFVMRIYLKTTPNKESVYFNYQPLLTGVLHKWLGENDIHGELALHSFSWLQGSKKINDTLEFKHGATFFISFYDVTNIRQIIKNEPSRSRCLKLYYIRLIYTDVPFLPPLGQNTKNAARTRTAPEIPTELLVSLFALLICNTAACFACRLTRGLAFAAAAVLSTLAKVASLKSLNSFHNDISNSELFF